MKNFKKCTKCQIGAWFPVLLWAAIIFFISSNPDPYRFLPVSWRSAVPIPAISNSSAAELLGQLMHFIEYAVLSFLIARALHSSGRGARAFHQDKPATPKIPALVVIIAMLYALSDETHQLFVPGRAFQVIDLVVDFVGVLFGVYLYTRLKIEPRRHEEEKKEKN